MHDIEHRRVRTNGIELHVALAGPPDGPPALLLHGFPDFWYGWRHQVPALAAAGFRVIVPDQRGYNTSDKPENIASYTHEVLTADATGLLDALGVERAYVVGHDWGGVIAWRLAQRHADRVARLAVLNCPHPSVFVRALRGSWAQRARSWYMLAFQLPWIPEAMFRRRGAVSLLAEDGTFTGEDLERYREAWDQPGALTGMINWYRAMRVGGLRVPSEPIRVPTLIVWGERDRYLGVEMARASAERCDDARLEVLPEAGHWVQDDAPDRVNQLLIAHRG